MEGAGGQHRQLPHCQEEDQVSVAARQGEKEFKTHLRYVTTTLIDIIGCSINDEILGILSPALVRIKMVHLGRNPITHVGWQTFK